MKTSTQGALALALSLACTSMAQATDKTPQQVFDGCIKDADKVKEDALKLCVGKTGQLLENCQKRVQNARIKADAKCTADLQQARPFVLGGPAADPGEP